MNKSRPVTTETVKSLNYTKNILQTEKYFTKIAMTNLSA